MIARAIPLVAIAVCCLMAGCENSLLDRSLVFFTNTTLGVEVSVSPSDATAPVKLIIGYKRAEGVLNPVYHSQGVEAPVTTDESEALTGGPKTVRRYRTEAYSVIAKIAGEVGGKAGDTATGKLSVAQWFATGEAAKILAKQPGIAGAVTGSSEIAKQAVAQAQFGSLDRRSLRLSYAALRLVYDGLKAFAAKPAKYPAAGVHVASLEALSQGPAMPRSFAVDVYDVDTSLTPPTLLIIRVKGRAFRQAGFNGLLTYLSYLNDSIDAIDTGLARPNVSISNNNAPTPADVKKVTDAQHAAQAESSLLLTEMGKSSIVRDAVAYYWGQVTGE